MAVKREILLERRAGWFRAAVLEEGEIREFVLRDLSEDEPVGAIFLGRVAAVKPGFHAAFVDIGEAQNAFLPLEEGERIKGGDWLLVQGCARQTRDSKGLRVTRRLQLSGPLCVLLPGGEGVGVSRKIASMRAAELRAMGERLCPQDCGLILRTAAEHADEEALAQEVRRLSEIGQSLQKKLYGTRPGRVYSPASEEERLAGIYGDARYVTDCEACAAALNQAREKRTLSPQSETVIAPPSLFERAGVDTAIDRALRREHWLPCGGFVTVDYCEAMTVYDVNAGKMAAGRDEEDTALRVNREAVAFIARHLRLCDIGGIVVVDLIDMREEASRRLVLQAFREAAAGDRMPVELAGISALGLLELTRKRSGTQLRRALRVPCPVCHGKGEVLSPQERKRRGKESRTETSAEDGSIPKSNEHQQDSEEDT